MKRGTQQYETFDAAVIGHFLALYYLTRQWYNILYEPHGGGGLGHNPSKAAYGRLIKGKGVML